MRLFESNHVSNVTEQIDGKHRTIHGTVLSQIKVNEPEYKVEIKVSINE